MSEILNIAHKGACGYYPENSLLAFERAVEMGCDAFEIDVQLSSDGKIVVFHDEELDNVSDGSGFLKDHTWAELKNLEITDNNEDEKYGVQRILSLKELLKMMQKNDIILNLELKNDLIDYPGMEEKVCEMLKEYKMLDRVIVSSFNHYSLRKFSKICPEIDLGILYMTTLIKPENYVDSLDFKVRSLHPAAKTLDQEVVKGIKASGYEIYPYTVNEKEELKKMIELGVDGIITDYPDRLKEILK
ncbi:glycerophosphodiester phosphodiesterase [Halanaerobium hydrogeniformans]|uniref:Glycerophosphoryl diester phosphodiesterase n=1 Tax=Halanaerobium hydrogeniformans TaxID=656519 RepID=E4RPS7_HALHG|nr:glycerophosphodiester phosphodiesterase family protein [Halanaerobium hydrogeniformans]ADQ13961.1 glycerophosphoryl diester phosphodiesterase [Halanaerobium hydrogeniformans]